MAVTAEAGTQVYYTCGKCSHTLFHRSIVIHEGTAGHGNDGLGVSSVKAHWGISTKETPLGMGGRCSSVFVEGMPEWANNLTGNNGRLSCPKCKARVGSYAWSGAPCSCGKWVTPAFQFQLSRVDPKGIVSLPVANRGRGTPTQVDSTEEAL